MLLTSFNRVRRFIGDDEGNVKADSVTYRRILLDWITAVSSMVQTYLNRNIESTSRTEYFDVNYKQQVYYPLAYPITTITSVKVDSTGLFDGSESTLTTDDYYIGGDNSTLNLVYIERFTRRKGLQLVYTGGMASHAVNTVCVVADGSDFTDAYSLYGGTSQAVGIVNASAETSTTIENLYGIFIAGETITEYSDEALTTATGYSTTISSITTQSLVEAYPDLVRAVEMEIRYMWKHKHDFENVTTTPDGNSTRKNDVSYNLQPEVRFILDPYRRMSVL